jgi:XRE family transcriptional regulator, regulator of sulfur utilization
MARSFRSAFGDAVRAVRQEKGVSQEDLGHLSGLHRNHVGQIERGELSPTIDSVELIAKALKVKPSELLARAEALR